MTEQAPAVAQQVREAVAEVLGSPPTPPSDEENLLSRGLDSLRTMALVGRWRSVGAEIDYAELAQAPTIAAWTRLLEERLPATPAPAPDPAAESISALDEAAAFPLTPVQQAYWIGRRDGQPLGGRGCHAYFEFDGHGVDPARLEAAVRATIARHGMLRARFLDDGTQRVEATSPWPGLTVRDLRDVPPARVTAALEDCRARTSHRRLEVAEGEVFDVQLSLLPDGATRIHFDIDLLVADVLSIQHLLTDLARHYTDPEREPEPPAYSFPRYLTDLTARRATARESARAYWQARIEDLPPGPELPLAKDPETVERPEFTRRGHRLSPEAWRALADRARAHQVTPAMALAAAYAEVLGAWSAHQRFVLNLPLFDRQPLHPAVGELVADFTNLVLVAVDTSDAAPFTTHARRLQRQFQNDVTHAEYSAVEVLRDLARARRETRAAAPVVFASNLGGEFLSPDFRRTLGGFSWMLSQTPQVWLDHQVYEDAGGLLLTWDAVEELFPDGVLDAMFAAYTALVERLATDEEAWDGPMPALLPAEQAERRQRVNATQAPESGKLLHQAAVETALRDGQRTALSWGDGETMRYDELLRRALAVNEALRAGGCQPGEPVAVVLDKGWQQVVAVLGVLLADGAYLPIDTNQPPARRQAVLRDAGVRQVITSEHLARYETFEPARRTVTVESCPPVAAGTPVPEPVAEPGDLAYVIYTSGSTGRPKGVMTSHRGAVNTVEDINRRFRVGPQDRVLALAALGFDLSVYDVFGLLAVGGRLVLPDAERRGDPSHWAELITGHGVTLWNSVPAQLQMLRHYLDSEPAVKLPSLRLALLSGDWIPVPLPDAVRRHCPDLELISLGGATEAAIWSIHHPITEVPDHWRSIPYGTPLANQSFHVLDAALRPRPDLTPGELWIGGVGVALGYLRDQRQTDERFLTHPVTGERLYRTGDLGRYLPDGGIEFLGREDTQVKVRGHRIELSEIESALLSHPDVGAAAVVVDGAGPTDRRLAAVVANRPLQGGAARAETVRETRELTDTARRAGAQVTDGVDLAEMGAQLDRVNQVAYTAMGAALRLLGAFDPDDPPPTTEQVLRRAGVAPKFHRVVRRWLTVLEQAGRVRRDPATGRYHALLPAQPDELGSALRTLEAAGCPLLWPEEGTALLARSMERLPELTRGELDQVRLLFPDGGLDTARAVYADSVPMRYLNRTAAALTAALAPRTAPGRPLRILEVGAGVGATTAELLRDLAGADVDYLFTDVSRFFLNEAPQRFAQHPGMRYGQYDINLDHRAQGYRPQSFDVIVAANVLHNARNIDRALASLRELLAPGGWLVFSELTTDRPDLMVFMEFLMRLDDDAQHQEADFEDRRRGRDQTFFDGDGWRALLTEAGAEAVVVLPEDDSPLSAFGQHLIAATFKRDRAPVDLVDLEDHLAERLPEYMIPSVLETVDALPLSANGKVDRKRVLSWLSDSDRPDTRHGAPPRDDLERRVAALWEAILGLPAVSREQSFFELGGDSLLIAQFVGRVRQELPEAHGISFDALLRAMLQRPTVAAISDRLRQGRPDPSQEGAP